MNARELESQVVGSFGVQIFCGHIKTSKTWWLISDLTLEIPTPESLLLTQKVISWCCSMAYVILCNN